MPAVSTPDLTSLRGRRALVTGGSHGIGREIAEALAAAGAEVVLPVRNRTKGEAARAAITAAHPEARIELADLDLSSLASVRALGAVLRAEGRPLHLLIANAGVMTPPMRQETADGFELQLGTNHLGHADLVAELLPMLRAGRARLVSQTSIAARSGRMLWQDPNAELSYDGGRSYAQSKIAVALFGYELDRRSRAEGWGITSAVAHPGVAPTRLLAARPEIDRGGDSLAVRAIRLASRVGLAGTPRTAAAPALRLSAPALRRGACVGAHGGAAGSGDRPALIPCDPGAVPLAPLDGEGLALLPAPPRPDRGGMGPEFWLTTPIAALTPGTGVLFTLRASLSGGLPRGLIAAAGCTQGFAPHLLLAGTLALTRLG